MLPGGETTLVYGSLLLLCVALAAASFEEASVEAKRGYHGNGDDDRERAVGGKPTDDDGGGGGGRRRRDRERDGRVRLTYRLREEEEEDGGPGVGWPAVRRRWTLDPPPGAAVIRRASVGPRELGPPPPPRRQTGGHFVHRPEPNPNPNPSRPESGEREPQSTATPAATAGKAQVTPPPHAPQAARSVAARCGEKDVTVEVGRDFLGNGQRVTPSDLRLGGCAADAAPPTGETLLFHAALPACGSAVEMTEESLIYTFTLVYVPTAIGSTSIIKTNAAQVTIQCHYPRKQLVSSEGVLPAWTPHASVLQAQQTHRFSLRLMTEDWLRERPSSSFLPGEVMHVEAAVHQDHRAPQRVYVDRCVATLGPPAAAATAAAAQPAYHFISNHGCLSDAKVSGGRSFFEVRRREDRLQFQLQTFRFPQDPRAEMFITCHLKAVSLPAPMDAEHKACSYLSEVKRWVASGGDNQVCGCCDTTCTTSTTAPPGRRSRRSNQHDDEDPVWGEEQQEEEVALGPILVQGTERLVGQQDLSSSSLVP